MFILQPRTIDMYIYPHLIASGYAACLVCFFSASCHNALDEPESEVRHEEGVLDCRPPALVAALAAHRSASACDLEAPPRCLTRPLEAHRYQPSRPLISQPGPWLWSCRGGQLPSRQDEPMTQVLRR